MNLVLIAMAAGILMALVVLATGFDHAFSQSGRLRATDYRARRRLILERLEQLSFRVERLAATVANKSPGSLAHLERLVSSFELIVLAFGQLPPFGTDPSQLDSAEFLVKDTEDRATELEILLGLRSPTAITRMASLLRDGIARATNRPVPKAATPDRGCYFCSRPFHLDLEKFSQVKVRLEGATRDVFSCGPCKDKLEETKKIKVLYFLHDGQPTHWSQLPGYVPSESYWDINGKVGENPGSGAEEKSKGRLRLIETKTDRLD